MWSPKTKNFALCCIRVFLHLCSCHVMPSGSMVFTFPLTRSRSSLFSFSLLSPIFFLMPTSLSLSFLPISLPLAFPLLYLYLLSLMLFLLFLSLLFRMRFSASFLAFIPIALSLSLSIFLKSKYLSLLLSIFLSRYFCQLFSFIL